MPVKSQQLTVKSEFKADKTYLKKVSILRPRFILLGLWNAQTIFRAHLNYINGCSSKLKKSRSLERP